MTKEDFENDLGYLKKIWSRVQNSYTKSTKHGMIFSEIDFELRVLRDVLNEDVRRVLIDDFEAFNKVKDFLSEFMPKYVDILENYDEAEPLFEKYGLEIEVNKALERKVWLRSGGYLVIDETEALVVIDVNTGKFVGKKDLEDTIFKTNLEAVREIAHQVRLRDCSGIIVVDFIDMMEESHREKIMEALRGEVKKDRVRVSVISMTGLGLVELTRKRLRPSLRRSVTEPCFYCEGAGRLKRKNTLICEIFRSLKEHIRKKKAQGPWVVNCHSDLVNWVYGEESELIDQFENALGQTVIFKADPKLHMEQFHFDKA